MECSTIFGHSIESLCIDFYSVDFEKEPRSLLENPFEIKTNILKTDLVNLKQLVEVTLVNRDVKNFKLNQFMIRVEPYDSNPEEIVGQFSTDMLNSNVKFLSCSFLNEVCVYFKLEQLFS